MVKTMPADWKCARPVCTNPLLGPESSAANQKVRKDAYSRSDGRKRSAKRRYRKNRKRRLASAKAWRQTHAEQCRASQNRYLAKPKTRVRISAQRRKKYAESAEFRAKEAERNRDYRERKLAAGFVSQLMPDGGRKWVPQDESTILVP